MRDKKSKEHKIGQQQVRGEEGLQQTLSKSKDSVGEKEKKSRTELKELELPNDSNVVKANV